MGRIRILLFVFLFFLSAIVAGCEEKKNPVSKYGDALISAHDSVRVAAEQATLKGMKDAVRVYRISNGKYPESFEELQKLMDDPVDPGLYQYDPDSGEVTLTK